MRSKQALTAAPNNLMKKSLEDQTVDSLGDEWRRFDQSRLSPHGSISPWPASDGSTSAQGWADVRFSDHVPYWCAVGVKA